MVGSTVEGKSEDATIKVNGERVSGSITSAICTPLDMPGRGGHGTLWGGFIAGREVPSWVTMGKSPEGRGLVIGGGDPEPEG